MMSDMPRIVILSNMPVTEGISGKIRGIRNIPAFLAERDNEIIVVSISDKNTKHDLKLYTEYEVEEPTRRYPVLRLLNIPSLMVSGRWLTTSLLGKNKNALTMLEKLKPDLIISSNFMLAGIIARYKRSNPGTAVISAFDSHHIIESFASRARKNSETESKGGQNFRSHIAERYIRFNMALYGKMLELSDVVALPTEIDRDDVSTEFPSHASKLIALDTNYLSEVKRYPIKKRIKKILFIGGYSHQPNRNAMEHIEKHIAPKLPEKEFIIVGKDCPVRKSGNVSYMGQAPDLSRYICEADLCIAPLTEGSGLKLKVLDYLSAGKAVIGTSIAFEGYSVINNVHAIVEDSIAMFPSRISELENDREKFLMLQKNARAAVEGFSYESVSRRWKELVEAALKKEAPGISSAAGGAGPSGKKRSQAQAQAASYRQATQARQQARQKARQKARHPRKYIEYSGETEKASLLKDQAKQSKQYLGKKQKPANPKESQGRRGMKTTNATNSDKRKKRSENRDSALV